MEVPLSGILFSLGIIAAFLSSIISEVSQEKITDILENHYKSAQNLQNLRLQFEYYINPYQIFELICYITGSIFLGRYIFATIPDQTVSTITIISIIIVFLAIRYFFQAIAMKYADELSIPFNKLILLIHWIVFPIFWLLNKTTEYIIGDRSEDSREEIDELVETAYSENILEHDEYKILKNTMNYGDITANEVMTPRTVIFSMNIEKTIAEAINKTELQNYSRFPVWEGESIDDGVRGYVLTKEILHAALEGKLEGRVGDFAREVSFIPEDTPLDEVLELFLNRRQHIFMVVDEYGGIAGLITMEDVLETILGEEIVDEADKIVDMRLLARQQRNKNITMIEEIDE